MTDRHVIHIISNTHWDREWLYNFQETRMQLVSFLDGLLDVLEKKKNYRSFVLDAQTAPIEDYLEIRPENRDRIVKQVQAGRILIGPWHTCPEGFEVNGESLARNLLMGHRVARAFGHVMKVGHTPFSYGQNSQMPQLYLGFGINAMLFYHGVSHDHTPNEWIFEGADGSRLLASQMSSMARYNFYHLVYRPAVFGKTTADREYRRTEGGRPFHRCAPDTAHGHHLLLEPRLRMDRKRFLECAQRLREQEAKVATTRHLAFMMGHDSSVAEPMEPEMVRLTRQACPEDEVVHGHYEEMMAAILEEADWDRLPVLRGERRVPKPMPAILHLYSDVLSSRTRMKRRSAEAEWLLQRRVEPWAFAAAALGDAYPDALLDLAWKTLLQCHAHDSISGSGVDAIEEDMMNRLRQVLDIGEGLYSRSLAAVQKSIDTSAFPEDTVLLTVYNPLPAPRDGVVTAVLDLPWEGPMPRGRFGLCNAVTGEFAPLQFAARGPHWAVVNHAYDAPNMMRSERFTVHFEAKHVPGLGYAVFHVDRSGVFSSGSLMPAANTLENRHIRVTVQQDGTLTLIHKETGAIFCGLHYFVDDGEAGHAWMHLTPAGNRVIDSRGFPVSIAMEEDGPLLARLRVVYHLRIPERLEENGGDPWQRLDGVGNQAVRSERQCDLTITSWFTLRKDSGALEVRTVFDNQAENHRLRLLLPTRRPGKTCHAESAFDVVERDTVFGPGSVWEGARNVTFPMQRFVDVGDGTAGFAFVSPDLREYEVTQDEDRAIAVTLLRAYEVNLATVSCRWERHPQMKLAQCPGRHEFSYLLHPHVGDYVAGGVLEMAEQAIARMEPVQAGPGPGILPMRHGFLSISPRSLLPSALKKQESGKGWALRLYNPTPQTVRGTLVFGFPVCRAALATLEEVPLEVIPVDGKVLTVDAGPKKIVTVLLEFETDQPSPISPRKQD